MTSQPPHPVVVHMRRHMRPRTLVLLVLAALAIVCAVAWGGFVARVHALRDQRTTGPSWSFPARFYSADLPLVAGPALTPTLVARELDARGYERVGDAPAPGEYADRGATLEIGLRGFATAPDPSGHGGPERVRLVFERDRLTGVERLGGYRGRPAPDATAPPRLEPVLFSTALDSSHVRRTWVPLARIPRVVQDAVIASEDRRFRQHAGLDLRGNARALFVNARARGVRQGASTLTQQLARGLFLGRERTMSRKLAEMAIAVGLERSLSKDQILEMYLNSVYWGQDGGDGVAGIAEAARHYFGIAPESLTLAQAALLAGIIPAPNAFSPFRNPEAARRARRHVLGDLVATGRITAAAAHAADREPLGVHHAPPPAERFPAAAQLARDELARRLGAGATMTGLAVFTTIDPAWQSDVEGGIAPALDEIEWPQRGRDALQGAFVAIEPRSGAVRAIVGGRDAQGGTFNRATQARRQPGSAIKPIVYAAALDPGRGAPAFGPASTVPDLRRSYDTPEGPWTPRNDRDEYHDTVTLAKALAKSLNVATANLVQAIGPPTVARYAEKFGLGKMKPVASIGLGSNEVTPLALTSAFTVFDNLGMREEPTVLRAAIDVAGHDRLPARPAPTRVLPVETATLMTGLLEDVVTFGVSYPLRKEYGFSRPVAGKTGTTNDYNDAWFVGFTPQVVAGIWVGHDQPRALSGPAAETALKAWAKIMLRLMDGVPPLEFAGDKTLALAWIDPYTGGLARGDCPRPMRVPFLPGTAPTKPCTRDHAADWAKIRENAAADSLRELGGEGSGDQPPAPADTTGGI